MRNLLFVALGGAIGASLRYLAGLAGQAIAGVAMPWVTLAVNVSGSAAMGLATVWLQTRPDLPPAATVFLLAGVLGGFTTFSAFSLDAILLWQRGEQGLSVAYILGSVLISLAGLLAGMWLARLRWM
jgi:CrcB protein